jgi:hypothetical protein
MKAGFVMWKEWEETVFMSRLINADEEETNESAPLHEGQIPNITPFY